MKKKSQSLPFRSNSLIRIQYRKGALCSGINLKMKKTFSDNFISDWLLKALLSFHLVERIRDSICLAPFEATTLLGGNTQGMDFSSFSFSIRRFLNIEMIKVFIHFFRKDKRDKNGFTTKRH